MLNIKNLLDEIGNCIIIYDFDGVMTNNKFFLNEKGEEMVLLNRSDGLAISYFKKIVFKQIIISTEKKPLSKIRAKKLKITCLSGVNNKLNELIKLRKKYNDKFFIYIGNDLNDLDIMQSSDFRFCSRDSHKRIISISDLVSSKNGGDGVIMDFYSKLFLIRS